ncbi:hypothetical protein V6Z11_A09G029400 [Gossypium hirsutum]
MSELKQYGGKAMVNSWSKPFYDAFSESKSVQLYEDEQVYSFERPQFCCKNLVVEFFKGTVVV